MLFDGSFDMNIASPRPTSTQVALAAGACWVSAYMTAGIGLWLLLSAVVAEFRTLLFIEMLVSIFLGLSMISVARAVIVARLRYPHDALGTRLLLLTVEMYWGIARTINPIAVPVNSLRWGYHRLTGQRSISSYH